MADADTDPWHYPRRELADNYVRYYGPIQSLTLFSERRTGKTTFVRNDLAPAAAEHGFQPAYVDLWTHQHDATLALVNGLRRSAQALEEPATRLGRALNRPVTGVSLPGLAGVQFANVPERGEPSDPLLQIEHWSDRLVAAAGRPVLLIVDEVQQIGVDRNGEATAAALRAALQRHDRAMPSFFTGSSADRLAAMFDDTGAAFYQYGSRAALPGLERGFTDFIADKYSESTRGAELDRDVLWSAFEALDRRPGSLREMVNGMLMAADIDVGRHLAIQQNREAERAERALAVKELTPTQLGVLTRLSHDLPLFSKDARDYYAQLNNTEKPLNTAQAHRAVRALEDKQLVHGGTGRADYRVTNQAVGEVLRKQYPTAGADHERALPARDSGGDREPEPDR